MDEDAPQPEPTTMERFAQVVVSAFIKAKENTAPTEHAARIGANLGTMDQWEEEWRPIAQDVLDTLGGVDQLPAGIQSLIQRSGSPEHATDWLVQVMLFIAGIWGTVVALTQIGSQVAKNEAWAQNAYVPLSPPDAADAVIRGVLSEADGAAQAAQSGINANVFGWLTAITGEPPGPMDFLKLMLRGDASQAETEHAIRYSRIRDEFIPYVLKMAYTQLSAADALEIAIKEITSLAEARALYVRGGGLDSDFDLMYQATGDSVGIQQALTLWKFGIIPESEVDAALGRSRINPMFYPLAKLTHFHPLSAFQISAAVKAGTITPAVAQQWLEQDGVPADQAHALANVHGSTGTTKAHTETESLVTNAYEEGIYQRGQAQSALEQIGYQPAVADLILTVADAKRANAQLNHAVSVVRANYVARRINRTTATNDLDTLQVPPAARNKWLADWDLEIAAHPKTLTAVQLADAGEKQFLTPEVVYARIQQEGYTPQDAAVLMKLHKAPLPPGAVV